MSKSPAVNPLAAKSAGDSARQFAADLRKLRVEGSNHTLARLQADTGVSRTVISEALAGRHLPSARTVVAIVLACGGEVHEWLERRDALTSGVANTAESSVPRLTLRAQSVSRRFAVLLAAITFVAGAAASALAIALIAPNTVLLDERTTAVVVTNGEDPALTPCVDDAVVATGDTRADNSLLEIIWSESCQAGWGRITRYDGLGKANTVSVAIYPESAPNGSGRQEATEHDVQGAYTTLVVRPTPDTLLCVEGSFTVDGRRIDLGDPLCT